jgi:pimeloyl-ACP methyl ester carboxylesterase
VQRIYLLLAVCLTGCTHWYYQVEPPQSAVVQLRTDDGWTIALHRYAPAAHAPARRHPVIVCHGVASNRHNWALGPGRDFPQWLAERGFEVFALELRASGDNPALNWTYTFDDYVLHDLPAAIRWVAARTGRTHWVGHSMGGMVLYGYLERGEARRVQSGVVVGSPAFAPDHLESLEPLIALYPTLRAVFDRLPSQLASRLFAPLAAPIRRPEQHVLWNPDNLAPATARPLAANGLSDLSGAVMDQLMASIEARRLVSADGHWDYTAELHRITTPLLFVAGVADALAPPSRVIAAYDGVRAPDKHLELLGRANGYAHDYGHLDLVLGDTAPTEVWPLLHDWLVAHD